MYQISRLLKLLEIFQNKHFNVNENIESGVVHESNGFWFKTSSIEIIVKNMLTYKKQVVYEKIMNFTTGNTY